MLNPSTADGAQDDPTIRKCVSFADAWGYGRLVVVNLFAFRATDPGQLARTGLTCPVGPENDAYLRRHAADAVTVCAWGSSVPKSGRPAVRFRHHEVLRLLRQIGRPRHLGMTKGGFPRHPLYLPGDCVPLSFPGAA
jgi:hypothetical protein